MFLKSEDDAGPVCVNMDTGLRFRPRREQNIAAGVHLIFPDGHTSIHLRGDFNSMCVTLGAVDGTRMA